MSTPLTEVQQRSVASPELRVNRQRAIGPPPPVWAGLNSPLRLLGQIGVIAMLLAVGGVVTWSVQGGRGAGVQIAAGAGPTTTPLSTPTTSSPASTVEIEGDGGGPAVLDQDAAGSSAGPTPLVQEVLSAFTTLSEQPAGDRAAAPGQTGVTSGSAGDSPSPTSGRVNAESTGALAVTASPRDQAPERAPTTDRDTTEPAGDLPPSSAKAGTPAPTSSTSPSATPAPSTQPATTQPATTQEVESGAGGGSEGGRSGALLFEDNFDRLNTSTWAVEHSTYGDGNNELQCYRPENVSVAGGKLILRAKTEAYTCPGGSTRQVTSGMVRSRGVTFAPGQALEFRVKLTPNNDKDQGGLWPAVWSSGFGSGGWPQSGEIDFLEVMTANNPKRSVYSIHYAKPGGGHGVTNRPVVGAANFSAQWHVVRFEYGLDGRLVWFLDGRQVHSVDAAATLGGSASPFDLPIREIKVNLALGGSPGPLAPGAVGSGGATFEMDYLRIYSL